MENDSEMISLDADDIKRRIFTVRGKQVMLDSDLAEYFGTTTGNLNRAMKRNIKRFPENFCFQLTDDEISRCQIGISMQTQEKLACVAKLRYNISAEAMPRSERGKA